ncbi:Crp/Fnr family transcriptional regulator [Fonticella tunisiensis]|uniref:Crp/Fnr family transcriptional regulator n=1 Tax=Fonticella tunisiensis TaxID=1096341 RepID=A0A4R7KAZ4_9CLOT|nr:Crp/Fnr family transcriptional regulator [Fonticella tunisiensis]TDT52063.1 Crp/Fnr family transcriptional regulator [Fonticella tunisiensis]
MSCTNGCETYTCEGCTGKYCARKVSIFSMLDDKHIKEVISMIKRRKYKKGQILFFEGDVSDKLFIINKGKIKIYKYTKEGKEQILYILSEGDFIGDLSLLKRGKYEFNAEALQDVDVCILTKDNFDRIIRVNPEIPIKMLEHIHDRVVGLEKLVQTLSTKDVEARLAGLLINFAKDFGRKTSEGIEINTPLSREEMANYIGITRETISRKLTSMQDAGIIELVGNKKIVIKDVERLEEML